MKSVCLEVEEAGLATTLGEGVAVGQGGSFSKRVWIWSWQHWMMDEEKASREAGMMVDFPFCSRVRSTAVC